MTMLRLFILAVAIALGTVLAPWWVVPLLGLGYGVVSRETTSPGMVAAVAGALGWGGYLALIAFGGAPVGRLASDLAEAMGLPGGVPILATLAFPALLAGTAAWLGARVGAPVDRGPHRR